MFVAGRRVFGGKAASAKNDAKTHQLRPFARIGGEERASVARPYGTAVASSGNMNFTEVIHTRRAVRAYSAKRVGEATVNALLRAAVQAPSAMNLQPWAFAVVQDPARLNRYSDRAKALLLDGGADAKTKRYEGMLRDKSFNIFYDATTLIVICCNERGQYTDADCWLAAENLMLAACDMGLGSCPIGFAVPALNDRSIKEELHIPPSGAAIAPIIVGYPSTASNPVPRAAPRILSWIKDGP